MSKENDSQRRVPERRKRRLRQERVFPQSKSPEQLRAERLAKPSRDKILGIVDAVTQRSNPELNKFVFDINRRPVLRGFVDGLIASDNGNDFILEDFNRRINPTSSNFDPRTLKLAKDMDVLFTIALDHSKVTAANQEMIMQTFNLIRPEPSQDNLAGSQTPR